jgi:hypothetical protein
VRYDFGGLWLCQAVVHGTVQGIRDLHNLRPITQLLPSFILMKADQARTLALHTTVQALASEMQEQAPGLSTPSRFTRSMGSTVFRSCAAREPAFSNTSAEKSRATRIINLPFM